MEASAIRPALRIALAYAAFAAFWVLLSDLLVGAVISDPAILTEIEVFKGWAFVVVTAIMLFWVLRAEYSAQYKAEQHLRESEQRFRAIAEMVPAGVFICHGQRFHYVNNGAAAITGYPCEELIARSAWFFVAPEHQQIVDALVKRAETSSSSSEQPEVKLVRNDGTEAWVELSAGFIQYGGQRMLLCTAFSITDRKRAEQQIRASLHEKEVLLREVHHRVKNNMQVISSLLSLQAEHAGQGTHRALFQESRNRVRSMALIHEKLYQSPNFVSIDFAAYLRDLASGLLTMYHAENVALTVDVQQVNVSLDAAIPCGLIVNELVTNSLKYGFPDHRPGQINISLRKEDDGFCELRVRDNGIGLPPGFDFRASASLGLQLVNMLVEQIGGSIEREEGEGTGFVIRFNG